MVCALGSARGQAPAAPSVAELAAENRALRTQVEAQQKLIEELKARMDAWDQSRPHPAPSAPEPPPAGSDRVRPPAAPSEAAGSSAVRLSAEAGVGYFATGRDGNFPTGEFRVDEARIYLEAQLTGNAFFHAELDPTTREGGDDAARLGQLYAELEDVWGPSGTVNLRAGRIDIPFGEEYQYRSAIDNPLIAHSLSDIWGFDGGVETYGSSGGLS